MSEKPTVSIIIPGYNISSTLSRVMNSVLGQTWKCIQVILIDDGSLDDTLAKAQEFAARDPRLTVLTQRNQGVSSARNAGLSLCTGKYVRFVDGDDELPANSVEEMVLRAEQDQADLVISGYTECIGSFSRRKNLANSDQTITCESLLRPLCSHANSYFYGVLWNKLFRRELIDRSGLRFQESLSWGEDFSFVMDYLAEASTISFLKGFLYDYHRNPHSLSVMQVFDCLIHPLSNIHTKWEMYQHLKHLYISKKRYSEYSGRLWIYLFRIGIN